MLNEINVISAVDMTQRCLSSANANVKHRHAKAPPKLEGKKCIYKLSKYNFEKILLEYPRAILNYEARGLNINLGALHFDVLTSLVKIGE